MQFLRNSIFYLGIFICFNCTSPSLKNTNHKIRFDLFYLENKNNNLGFSSARKEDFKILNDARISYKNGIYWFKVILKDNFQLNKKIIFQAEEPSIQSISIYNNEKLLNTKKSKKGNTVIISELENSLDSVYYLKVNFKRQVHFPLNVYTSKQFYKAEEKKNLGFGLYYGLAIMVFVLNITFYIALKDKSFLYYSLFMACINISFTAFDGTAYLYFSQDIFDDFLIIFHLLIQVFGALFASKFLNLKYFYPRLNILGMSFITIPASFYFLFYITNNFLYFAIGDFLGLLVLAYYWAMGFVMIKKEEFAKYFVIGYCMVLFAAIFYLTPLNFGLTTLTATFNQLKFGNILEMLVLTYAITRRVQKLQEENNNYRNELKIYLDEIYGLKEQLKNSNTKEAETTLNAKIEKIKNTHNLTDREVDILLKITEGLSNSEIADALYISINTVKYHTRNLYEKLDVKKRTEISSKIIFDR